MNQASTPPSFDVKILPCLAEAHAINGHEDIHSRRRHAHLVEPALLREVLRTEPCQGSTETSQRLKHTLSIFHRRLNPNVEILRVARRGVEHYRVPAYDEIPNAVCVEKCSTVLRSRSSSLVPPLRECASTAICHAASKIAWGPSRCQYSMSNERSISDSRPYRSMTNGGRRFCSSAWPCLNVAPMFAISCSKRSKSKVTSVAAALSAFPERNTGIPCSEVHGCSETG